MQVMPQSLFDVYALALPRGHGFGNQPPVGAWQSEDELTCGIVTHNVDDCKFGVLVIRIAGRSTGAIGALSERRGTS